MRANLSVTIRLSIALICMLVLHKMVPIIFRQWQGIETCPALGMLPACYLVFTGYSIILLSAIVSVMLPPTHRSWHSTRLFLFGWSPVFIMALYGTSLELLGQPTCPRTSLDIPLCFFSLVIACVLLAGFMLTRQPSST